MTAFLALLTVRTLLLSVTNAINGDPRQSQVLAIIKQDRAAHTQDRQRLGETRLRQFILRKDCALERQDLPYTYPAQHVLGCHHIKHSHIIFVANCFAAWFKYCACITVVLSRCNSRRV